MYRHENTTGMVERGSARHEAEGGTTECVAPRRPALGRRVVVNGKKTGADTAEEAHRRGIQVQVQKDP